MKTAERMTIEERFKYLRLNLDRYRQAGRKEKARLLDEMEAVTGLHRKSLIRLLNSDLVRQRRQRQRGRVYGIEMHNALRVIAESCDWICAERLQPNLIWLARHLAAHGELALTDKLEQQLVQASLSTVGRILQRLRQDEPRLPHRSAGDRKQAANQIPMERIAWDEAEPGHLEVDLVHHCGVTSDGHYIHSLQCIDVATGWSERMALLGRSFRAVRHAFETILLRMPFPVLEIHSDNGGEFLQDHMLRFWQTDIGTVVLTRGRPYRKNDQRFVEQKNATLIRSYFGSTRLDTVEQTLLMNEIYTHMWLYYNFFQPVMRLAEKVVETTEDGGLRVKRIHDQPRTPFDRLCATGVLPEATVERLTELRDRTNPRELRQKIYQLRDRLFRLPGAEPGKTEDVFETLLPHCPQAQGQRTVSCGCVDNSPQAPSCPHIHSFYFDKFCPKMQEA